MSDSKITMDWQADWGETAVDVRLDDARLAESIVEVQSNDTPESVEAERKEAKDATTSDMPASTSETVQFNNNPLIVFAPFEEGVDSGENDFPSHILNKLYSSDFKQSDSKKKDDPQKLVVLEKRNSELSKDVLGTQWKSIQFRLQVMEDGRSTAKFLPFFWAHKDTGVNVRARIRGANVARKLVMEFTVYHNSEPQHKAFLEFHAASHVSEYGLSDKTVQDAKNDKKGKKRSDYGNSLEEDSYLVIRFVTTGGIGIGLDFDAYYFDQDDREVLYYARHLAQNFSQSPGPKRVAFRMNARWVEYGLEQTKNIRQRAEWERLERAVSQFPKDCSRVLAPYRSQQGTPLTQWGMFAARSRIAKKPGGIVSFPAQTSFSTIDEARITLAYGCYLEYRREFEISQAISNQQHGVAFIRVANSTILAILKLNMPQGLMMERWAPREGTMVKLAFKLPDKLDSKDTFCNAVAVPDMFGLPYEGGCLFLVPGANFGFYSKFAAPVGQALVYLPTKLILRVPQSGAQRQVDAVNRLSEQENLGKWQPLLLNHRAGKRSMVDPTAPLNPAAGVVMSKVQEVIGKLDWSESQKACIKSLQSFPAGMLLIQGFPGTGKTLTLVAMASVLLSLGAHVLFTAPSHYAADAICESMDKWERLTGENLNPIRVYRPFSERKAFKTHGRPGEEHIEDEGAEIDSDKLTSAEIPLNEEDSSNDEGFMRQVFSAEAQLQMVQLVKAIKDDAFTKSYGITTKSLEAHVIRAAKDTSQTLMARYPSPEQIAISRGNLFELLESDGFNPEGEDVDMLAELRHYVNLLQEQPFGDFEEEDRRKALLTFQKVSQMVVQKSRLIVSTSNNTGDKLIASNFGQDALGVMIIRDEDTKETETNSWVPVAKLLNSDRICGIVSCGDEKQLQPTVISLQGKDQYNEFAPQISLALPTRLGRMGHPIIKLTEQFRYRPVFAKWPNRRTYEGLLASHQRTEAIKVNANFVKAMANAFAYNGSASTDFGNVVASVEGSTCVVDEVSKSRYNDNHRLFILRLILANKTHDGYPASDITIVCPYQAQVLRLRKSLFSMQQGGLLASSDIPRVATTDSMQGKEAKVIVHDWVISQGDSFSDLGFTTDDHRGTVALTRMSEVMINILPESVGTGARAVAPVERFNYLGDRIESQVPYPCAFMQWAQANRIVLEVNCPKEDEFIPPASTSAPPPPPTDDQTPLPKAIEEFTLTSDDEEFCDALEHSEKSVCESVVEDEPDSFRQLAVENNKHSGDESWGWDGGDNQNNGWSGAHEEPSGDQNENLW